MHYSTKCLDELVASGRMGPLMAVEIDAAMLKVLLVVQSGKINPRSLERELLSVRVRLQDEASQAKHRNAAEAPF